MKKIAFLLVSLLLLVPSSTCTERPATDSISPSPNETEVLTFSSEPTFTPTETKNSEDDFLLPVYPNTIAAGHEDYYAVLDNGKLIMWGNPEYGTLRGGSFEKGPITLMDNVAAVYVMNNIWYQVVAIDRDGTLWGLDGFVCTMNPAYNKETWDGPVLLMENVAAISIAREYAYILKKDGTLWHWGGWEGFPGYFEYQWKDPKTPGKPECNQNSLTQIMDSVVHMGNYASASGGGWALTKDRSLWEWYTSYEIRKMSASLAQEELEKLLVLKAPSGSANISREESLYDQFDSIAQIQGNFILQKDGTLWYFHSSQDMMIKYLEGVEQIAVSDAGILLRKTDGSYWHQSSYTSNNPYLFTPEKVLDPVV